MVGGISKLYLPESLCVLGFACVGVAEPGLCAPLSPEELALSVMSVGVAGWRIPCGLFLENVSLVGAKAEHSLQRAGIPPSPSGSHKYLLRL